MIKIHYMEIKFLIKKVTIICPYAMCYDSKGQRQEDH